MLAHVGRPTRIEPGPGQESVWDYPRPPRVEPSGEEVVVEHAGREVARTTGALRVLETSQAPGYYLPASDVDTSLLVRSAASSWCEWKGAATYWDLAVPGAPVVPQAVWSYDDPTPAFAAIAGHFAVYPQAVDACWVDGERVEANEGGFYGGWVTSRVVGPFKGGPGSLGW